MASISSLTGSSSASSIYGNRNIISGLASGLDTEALIENSVAGYKTKIQDLLKQQTKLTWKQDAYRSIIDKMAVITEKYTSFTSKTNLMSHGFFNNAIKNITNGKNADKISATGRTSSTVRIDAVKQLATAARYNVDVGSLGLESDLKDGAITGKVINFDEKTPVSDISGSLTISYENNHIAVNFGENEKFADAQAIVNKINDTLQGQQITVNGTHGGTDNASKFIHAVLKEDGTTIALEEINGNENGGTVYISGASGDIKDTLGITSSSLKDPVSSFSVKEGTQLFHEVDNKENLSGKTISVTLDGITKEIQIGNLKDAAHPDETLLENLQSGLKKAFGDKVTVEMKDGALSFAMKENNSSLKITSRVSESLGLGENGVTSYLNTGKTLGELLGVEENGNLKGVTAITYSEGELNKAEDGSYTDKAGNSVMAFVENGVTNFYRVDKDNNKLYDLKVNDISVGAFSKDTALDTVMLAINRSDANVTVNYSQMTNKFTFKANETGASGRIDIDEGLGAKLFGNTKEIDKSSSGVLLGPDGKAVVVGTNDSGQKYYAKQLANGTFVRAKSNGTIMYQGSYPIALEEDEVTSVKEQARKGYTHGTDATAIVTVNGQSLELNRSSNIINVDGMSVTLKDTFNEEARVSGNKTYVPVEVDGEIKGKPIDEEDTVNFTTKADSDTIVDAVKSFVDEINAVLKEVHDAYSTQPNKDSKYNTYDPLTDDEKADLSDKEIEKYEEKAKQGLLFADNDLSRLYSALRTAMSGSGMFTGDLRDIGITTTYSEGLTSIKLNEDTLREALEANPDKVREVFANSKEGGASKDGLMVNVSKVLKTYASTSYGNYGILVKKAGTKLSTLSLNDNFLQKQMNSLDNEIDKWQSKMGDKIDYYTRQFTALESLMNKMNSQSSALANLMGG